MNEINTGVTLIGYTVIFALFVQTYLLGNNTNYLFYVIIVHNPY